jgi:phospholipase/carboxylesterase
MEMTLEGPAHAPLSCGKAVYLVVLLHGRGVDGHHVVEIGMEWGATLNKAKFVAPHAPFSDPANPSGRQWFSTGESDPQQKIDELNGAAAMLDAYLDELLASHRLADSHLALVGFGQGATLALYVGLRRANTVGAIVAVSSAIEDAEHLAHNIRSRPPTLLVHAAADPETTQESMMSAQIALSARGVTVQTLSKPGDYFGLDEEGINLTADFLRQSLVEPSSERS